MDTIQLQAPQVARLVLKEPFLMVITPVVQHAKKVLNMMLTIKNVKHAHQDTSRLAVEPAALNVRPALKAVQINLAANRVLKESISPILARKLAYLAKKRVKNYTQQRKDQKNA